MAQRTLTAPGHDERHLYPSQRGSDTSSGAGSTDLPAAATVVVVQPITHTVYASLLGFTLSVPKYNKFWFDWIHSSTMNLDRLFVQIHSIRMRPIQLKLFIFRDGRTANIIIIRVCVWLSADCR